MIMKAWLRRTGSSALGFARGLLSANNERGSAILETAMSAVILLTFLFGIIETGFALYSYHFISEAAREGTRYAIVRGSSCVNPTDFSSACPASTSDIQNYVKNLGFPGINPTNMTVSVIYAGYPAGVTCTPSTACNNPGNMIKVTVQYNFPLTVPFIPPHTYAMSSTAAMIIQQ
jgi:Flp pilus assembly protein TadG